MDPLSPFDLILMPVLAFAITLTICWLHERRIRKVAWRVRGRVANGKGAFFDLFFDLDARTHTYRCACGEIHVQGEGTGGWMLDHAKRCGREREES